MIHIYVYRQSCFVHSSVNWLNWKMTFRKPAATTSKINENQVRQLFLNPWHMLSSIWVLLGLWLVIYTVKIQFSFIFPASAWSPFLSVNLTDKLARLVSLLKNRHCSTMWGPQLWGVKWYLFTQIPPPAAVVSCSHSGFAFSSTRSASFSQSSSQPRQLQTHGVRQRSCWCCLKIKSLMSKGLINHTDLLLLFLLVWSNAARLPYIWISPLGFASSEAPAFPVL